jgi:hypothetical protein
MKSKKRILLNEFFFYIFRLFQDLFFSFSVAVEIRNGL